MFAYAAVLVFLGVVFWNYPKQLGIIVLEEFLIEIFASGDLKFFGVAIATAKNFKEVWGKKIIKDLLK